VGGAVGYREGGEVIFFFGHLGSVLGSGVGCVVGDER
jgi:hypothetical protein